MQVMERPIEELEEALAMATTAFRTGMLGNDTLRHRSTGFQAGTYF
jgi:hypothetical protein